MSRALPFNNLSDLQYDNQAKMMKMLEYLVKAEQKKQLEEPEIDSIWFFQHKDTFRKLRKYVEDLEETFGDKLERIVTLGAIKDEVEYLTKQLDRDVHKYERRLCIVIYDSIVKVKAEEMSIQQLETLGTSFQVLFSGKCNQTQFKEVEKMLRRSGLNWIVGGTFEEDIS
ncbi:MAG: hypothetical protein ACQEXV_18975 [Bacillota bacterium]|uniref:hypothetical protein n=1 Tax=Paenibacillus jamilae TaxID=114136 RepID=UPI000E3D3366|nr:hypothetical protein [Paenibacillus jamilae]RFT93267.1 hypothetical protein DX902_22340 [Paenibacillus jamilae]